MSKYTLDQVHYTWKNAFLWGNCIQHLKETQKGNLSHRIVHALIAMTQICPILSQISSIAEKLMVNCIKPSHTQQLDPKRISEIPLTAEKVPVPKQLNIQKDPTGKKFSPVKASPQKTVIPQTHYLKRDTENGSQFRARIFQETLRACEYGYEIENKHIELDHTPMLNETISYGELNPLSPTKKMYKTEFNVIPEDTFQVILKRKAQGGNPVGINMANRFYPGGGVESGCTAQEEALCRRSNHILGLKTQPYPLHVAGGIYCPHVLIFRDCEFSFMDEPQETALVAVAGFNLSKSSSDRFELGLPLEDHLTHEFLEKCTTYIENTEAKIRNMLRVMSNKGHTQLVLGALGCGAFQNPPTLVAKLFKSVFLESEFAGRFEKVDFAILKMNEGDQYNIDAFTAICEELN